MNEQKIKDYEQRIKDLEFEREMDNGCFSMIAEALTKVGCCHGHDMTATPPMMYSDAILCSVKVREQKIAELTKENDQLRRQIEELTAKG